MTTHDRRTPDRAPRRPALLAARGAVTLLAVVIAWLVLAPQSIGGGTAYLSVHGNSMAPELTHGDLAVVRRAERYQVGDAVAVRHPTLGLVLHRIVSDDGERFTLQGDNRPTIDHYRPLPEDVTGKLRVGIPHAGSLLAALQRPATVAGLVVGTLLLVTAGLFVHGGRRRRGRPPEPLRRTAPVAPGRGVSLIERAAMGLSLQSAGGQALAGALAVVVVAAALLLLVHQSAGTTRREIVTLAVAESGRFTYGDEVASAGVYDANRFAAPQPVYLEVVRRLPVAFEYALQPITAGEELTDVVGAYTFYAEVLYPNGGSLTLPIQDATLFAGPTARIEGAVDLRTVLATIAASERQTGVSSLFYQLRIAARVDVDGRFGGVPFERQSVQDIEFRLTEKQLQFDAKESALESEANVTVGRAVSVPRTIDLPVLSGALPFVAFPWLAAAGLTLASLGFLLLGIATRIVSRLGPAAAIRARYGHLLVTVAPKIAEPSSGAREHASTTAAAPPAARVTAPAQAPRRAARRRLRARRAASLRSPSPPQHAAEPAPAPTATPAVATSRERSVIVESFDDLARLAEQRALAVLTTHHGDIDEYVVIDDDVTYRFAALASRSRAARSDTASDPPLADSAERSRGDDFRLAS